MIDLNLSKNNALTNTAQRMAAHLDNCESELAEANKQLEYFQLKLRELPQLRGLDEVAKKITTAQARIETLLPFYYDVLQQLDISVAAYRKNLSSSKGA